MQINLDGPILRALTRAFDTIVATVLFLICSLPVVTMGASLSAMYATMIATANDGCSGVTRYFFGKFKENFKQATLLWLPIALVGLVVAGNIIVCWGFEMEATMILAIMRGLTIFSTALYTAVSIYVFAGIAVYQVTWKQAISNALIFIVKNLPATLGLLLLSAVMVASVFVLWYFAVPVFAVCLYYQGKLLCRIFGLIEPEEHHEEEIHY